MFIFFVISGVLIEPTGLDAEIDQLVVDFSAAQIFDGVGGAVVGLRQKQHLFLLTLSELGKRRAASLTDFS